MQSLREEHQTAKLSMYKKLAGFLALFISASAALFIFQLYIALLFRIPIVV